jgi:hypothetical protein
MTLVFVGAAVAFVAVVVLLVVRRMQSKTEAAPRRPSRRKRSDKSQGGGALSEIDAAETEDERKLRRLRALQRSEKIRESQEEAQLAHKKIEHKEHELDESALRLQQLRDLQRAEKIREAVEDLQIHGPDIEPDQTIGSLITHNVMEMRHEQSSYKEKVDLGEVNRVVAEAHDLINDMNAQFGWKFGEASIPDRMFNTDVESVLGEAVSTGKVDYRMKVMVATMRSHARAATGGRSELAQVMAARVIMGSAQLSEEESAKLNSASRLFGDEFAEAEGFADQMSRTEELIAARKLGLDAPHATEYDRGHGLGRGIGR